MQSASEKNAVTVIKIKFRLEIISFWFVLLQAIIRRTINSVFISSIGLLQTSSYFRDAWLDAAWRHPHLWQNGLQASSTRSKSLHSV